MRLVALSTLLCATWLAGCATGPRGGPSSVAPFTYLDGHFLVVPVQLGELHAEFILDTGIGVNLVSKKMCERLGCVMSGSTSGKRMSGQTVTFPLATLPSLTFAGRRATNVTVGVLDFEDRHFGVDPKISGFLSLDFFRDVPFTIDYRTRTVRVESAAGLAERRAHGVVAPLRFEEEGRALDVFAELTIAGKASGSIEIDTGSPALTLDERYLGLLGISSAPPAVRVVSGEDETGYRYVRYLASAPVTLALALGLARAAQPVRVMFQKIIHDGLIGDAFLKQFTVTFDLPRHQLILGPR